MSKYIDAEKLIAEIESLKERAQAERVLHPKTILSAKNYLLVKDYDDLLSIITSLQQEQPKTDMKSPFTGGKIAILSREEEVTFRGEKVKILRKYYRCEDTGREFINDKLDDDMMWTAFRAYCEKKGMTSFTDIMLKQEQSEVNIWHDVKKEAPTNFGAEIIVLCKNKNKEDGIWLADLIQCFEGEYKPRENWEDPVKWAYLSEILPQRD